MKLIELLLLAMVAGASRARDPDDLDRALDRYAIRLYVTKHL